MKHSMKTFYFVRHGQSHGNLDKVMCGRFDTTLTELGRKQADACGRYLNDKGIQALISSDLTRASETAQIINKHLDLNLQFDSRLQERACGIFEGIAFEDIRQDDAFHKFMNNPQFNVDGGETISGLYERISDFMHDLVRSNSFEKILLVSHGGVLWTLVPFVLGVPIDNYSGYIGMDNCSVTEVVWEEDRGFVLSRLNVANHLNSLGENRPSWHF